ncbi:MAG: hypothetical protein D3910_13010 [Candidatus Electrothrix sp. ATG2]|nr:hypothetical protein [Candidatus Electrothrix sp. ATG2]
MSNIVSENVELREAYQASLLESAGDFGAKTSELTATVDSCSFLLGPELSFKAKEIAEAYLSIAYGVIDKDKDGIASGLVRKIDGMISAFEDDARKYLV